MAADSFITLRMLPVMKISPLPGIFVASTIMRSPPLLENESPTATPGESRRSAISG